MMLNYITWNSFCLFSQKQKLLNRKNIYQNWQLRQDIQIQFSDLMERNKYGKMMKHDLYTTIRSYGMEWKVSIEVHENFIDCRTQRRTNADLYAIRKKHQGKDKKENVSNNVWQNWSTIVKSTKSNVSIYVVYWMFSSFKPKVKWRTTSTNYQASYFINYINAEETTEREQQLYLVLRYTKTYFSKSTFIKNQR